MSDKLAYREFCEFETSIPLFSQPWWLDLVCGEQGWDVVVYQKNGKILGSLPFHLRRRLGFTLLTTPQLTQTLGIWLAESNAKYANRLGSQKDIIQGLIKQLPAYHVFSQCFHHRFDNWLPLFWEGFEQSTKYTYVLEDISSLESLWKEINPNIRTDIRKAEKSLEVRNDVSTDEFWRVVSLTYSRQGLKERQSLEFLKRVFSELDKRKAGQRFSAIDAQGRTHAVALVVWDNASAYYLIGGADPQLRNSGAGSLCVWEAIKMSATVTKAFDFEGSMVEGIERFFRGFGARQKQYFRLMHFRPSWLGMLYYLKRRRSKTI